MTDDAVRVDVLLSEAEIEALLEGAGESQGALHDAHCALRSGRAWLRLNAAVLASRGPAPDRRRGGDRRGGSVSISQILAEPRLGT